MQAMNGYLRTALSLQELSETDRRWFLAQLPAPDRQRISAVLERLQVVPCDTPAFLGESNAGITPAATGELDIVRRWDVATWVTLMNDEPECVVAAVLSVNESIKDDVLMQLPATKSASVLGKLQRMQRRLTPRAQATLVHTLIEKAQQHGVMGEPLLSFESALTKAWQPSAEK